MKPSLWLTAVCMSLAWLPVAAATFTVTNTNDDLNPGSLRRAITDANATAGATPLAPHVINITATGTINLATVLPALDNHIAINGPGGTGIIIQRSTSTATLFRIFAINLGKTVTMGGLTIARGNATSGLTGGGIFNVGTLTVSNCTITRDTSGSGGGIFNNGGTLSLINSTLSANFASSIGGGLYNNNGTTKLTNCTVSGNSSPVGAGADNAAGSTQPLNTIIAGNTGTTGPDVFGTFTSQGHNFIGRNNGSTGWVASDIQGTTASPQNPQLGSLADNGGPTQTMALQSSSGAIDAGDNVVTGTPLFMTTDQRAYNRPVNGTVDIGAFEFGATDQTLPVELAEFNASAVAGGVQLWWRTASEIRNAGFEVQRAGSDSLFTPVASYLTNPALAGLGTTSQGKSYSYLDDAALLPGETYYYRLVDISTDGIRTEHAPLAVQAAAPDQVETATLRLYPAAPNPVRNSMMLRFSTPQTQNVAFELFSADGKKVATLLPSREFATGEHSESVDLDGLSSGSYMLRMTAGNQVRMIGFVVVR